MAAKIVSMGSHIYKIPNVYMFIIIEIPIPDVGDDGSVVWVFSVWYGHGGLSGKVYIKQDMGLINMSTISWLLSFSV